MFELVNWSVIFWSRGFISTRIVTRTFAYKTAVWSTLTFLWTDKTVDKLYNGLNLQQKKIILRIFLCRRYTLRKVHIEHRKYMWFIQFVWMTPAQLINVDKWLSRMLRIVQSDVTELNWTDCLVFDELTNGLAYYNWGLSMTSRNSEKKCPLSPKSRFVSLLWTPQYDVTDFSPWLSVV